jgi:hypothetical protein
MLWRVTGTEAPSPQEQQSATRQPSALAFALGILWWIVALIISFQDGPIAGLAWIAIPYSVIAAHEAGHLVAAWIGRVPMSGTLVRIGVGPAVGVVGGRLRLGLLPGSGSVTLPFVVKRWQRAVVALGGAAGNLLFAIALAIVSSRMRATPVWIGVPALASLAVGTASLIPFGSIRLGRTDALRFIRSLTER